MESGGSSNSQCGDNRRVPNSGIVIEEPDVTVNTPINGSNQYVPIANVIKIMRRILPANAKIAEDAKETIQECVTEFISFITHEANENSRRECRKTITAADIISAMGTLGFDDYVEPLTVFLNKYRARDQEHSAMQHMPYHRLDTGIVQQPAAQMATHSSLQAQPTTMGYLPPLPPTGTMDGGDYVEWPQDDGYSFMGNPGGGEGSSSGKEFDPFNQF